MSRPILSLRLPAAEHTRLLRAGCRTVGDLDPAAAPAVQLPAVRTAAELGRVLRTQAHIATGVGGLDALLGGRGVPVGAVSEVVAHPAAAAALCLRLCVAAGAAGAVYIDTAGAFSARSLCGMAGGAAALERTHVFRVYAAHELVALAASLDRVVERLGGVRVVVVNSGSWPFLASFPDDVLRRQAMHAEAARLLAAAAARHQIAVVVVSQPKAGAAAAAPRPMDGAAWTQVAALSLTVRPLAGGASAVGLAASSLYPPGEARVILG